jgi:ATP-dependent DNA helicase RecG
MKIVERVSDGFQLAEEDLRIRGPGDYLGTRQSGLPDLKIASIMDQEILSLARREAIKLLDSDPDLQKHENSGLAAHFKNYASGLAGELS